MRSASTVARTIATAALACVAAVSAAIATPAPAAGFDAPAPEFTHHAPADWINSAPLSMLGLRGSVVLIDVWAFECWNCYRSFPWLHSVQQKYAAQGLRVIGVHTPELPAERNRDQLIAKIAEYKLDNPVMLDNDYSYWNALGNQYWPAFYLIGRDGRIRHMFVGETHIGDGSARQIEAALEEALAEPATEAGAR